MPVLVAMVVTPEVPVALVIPVAQLDLVETPAAPVGKVAPVAIHVLASIFRLPRLVPVEH
jgi:hypothetical protein